MAEEGTQRRLAAMLAADVVGYSRLMEADEVGTLAALKERRKSILQPLVADHSGRIVKVMGDGVLVEFASAVNAVACAVELQKRMASANASSSDERQIVLRIGVNLGDVMVEGSDLYGDGINIAARLEDLAEPGGILVSGTAYDHIKTKVKVTFEDLGSQVLKNIVEPVRVYRVTDTPAVAVARLQRAPGKPAIAVLPFTNMSGDPEQEYFSDGITEDIITDLSRVSAIFVVARNTSFTFKGKAVEIVQAARQMKVGYVLEGSVRRAGSRVRITAQLIDAATGHHLWAERYDREFGDIFALQDDISKSVVNVLKVKLLPEEMKAIGQAPTDNVEAYNTYLRGLQFFHMETKSSLTLARRMFARAFELDPRFARAYASTATCDLRLYSWHGVKFSVDDILDLTGKALEIESDLAEALAARGYALMIAGRRIEAASAFERALVFNPESFDAHYSYGKFWVTAGEFERAAKHYLRATEIRPDDYQSPKLLQQALQSLGRSDEAAKFAEIAVKRAEEALRLHPEGSKPAQMGACAFAFLGERDRAKEWLARALAIDPDDNNARFNAACTYSLLGELDRAVDLLEVAIKQLGSDVKRRIKTDSDLDAIRTHPRYQRLLELAGDNE